MVDAAGKPLQAYVSLVDVATGARVYNGRPDNDGTFLIYAMEGSRYELSVDPEHGSMTYFSRTLDLTVDPIPQVEKVEAVLKPVIPGDEFLLDGIKFKENSAEVDLVASQRALQRFARLITSNATLNFEVQVLFEGYEEDSVQSRPDLTEVRIDTVHWLYIDIDTLGQLYERDTASLKVVYHNDRSTQQLNAVIEHLIGRGAPADRLGGFANAVPAVLPGDRRTVVKARVTTGM